MKRSADSAHAPPRKPTNPKTFARANLETELTNLARGLALLATHASRTLPTNSFARRSLVHQRQTIPNPSLHKIRFSSVPTPFEVLRCSPKM